MHWLTLWMLWGAILGQGQSLNSIWISHVGGKNAHTWAVICCLPDLLGRSWIGHKVEFYPTLIWYDTSVLVVAWLVAPHCLPCPIMKIIGWKLPFTSERDIIVLSHKQTSSLLLNETINYKRWWSLQLQLWAIVSIFFFFLISKVCYWVYTH